jgi:hypothetical protein
MTSVNSIYNINGFLYRLFKTMSSLKEPFIKKNYFISIMKDYQNITDNQRQ